MSNSTYCDDHYEQPEWMKEMEQLRQRVKELEAELDKLPKWHHGIPPHNGWFLTKTIHRRDGSVTISCEPFFDVWEHEFDNNVMYMDLDELKTLPKED